MKFVWVKGFMVAHRISRVLPDNHIGARLIVRHQAPNHDRDFLADAGGLPPTKTCLAQYFFCLASYGATIAWP
jgi:hypothetical protein